MGRHWLQAQVAWWVKGNRPEQLMQFHRELEQLNVLIEANLNLLSNECASLEVRKEDQRGKAMLEKPKSVVSERIGKKLKNTLGKIGLVIHMEIYSRDQGE